MPKPNSKKFSPAHIMDAPLDKLPGGEKKDRLKRLRAQEQEDFSEEDIEVDEFMRITNGEQPD